MSGGLSFYEFFAGGGMARLGLGSKWTCLASNEICEKKARTYRANFGSPDKLILKDVNLVVPADLDGRASLAWASFPCQDLSLAGNRAGLNAERSGTFWPFWRLMKDLNREGRGVPVIVLENVVGAITSHGGKDFQQIVEAMVDGGYRVGAMVVNAVRFIPQSRPRLFIIAVKADHEIPDELVSEEPLDLCHPSALTAAYAAIPKRLQKKWIWWNMPAPRRRKSTLTELIEDEPSDVTWHTAAETSRLLKQMSETNLQKVKDAQKLGSRIVGTIYKRTRVENGEKFQRAEVRFDQVSGCLRTPAGGSSRQLILMVEGKHVRSRLLSAREAARLMGVPDNYKLPNNYNEAYHLMGDGLAVPVVSWLEKNLLSPLVNAGRRLREAA